MTALEAIHRRRSIRKHQNRQIPEEALRQILEAVYGIHIGDAVIGQAVARYNSRQAIITGRA